MYEILYYVWIGDKQTHIDLLCVWPVGDKTDMIIYVFLCKCLVGDKKHIVSYYMFELITKNKIKCIFFFAFVCAGDKNIVFYDMFETVTNTYYNLCIVW